MLRKLVLTYPKILAPLVEESSQADTLNVDECGEINETYTRVLEYNGPDEEFMILVYDDKETSKGTVLKTLFREMEKRESDSSTKVNVHRNWVYMPDGIFEGEELEKTWARMELFREKEELLYIAGVDASDVFREEVQKEHAELASFLDPLNEVSREFMTGILLAIGSKAGGVELPEDENSNPAGLSSISILRGITAGIKKIKSGRK